MNFVVRSWGKVNFFTQVIKMNSECLPNISKKLKIILQNQIVLKFFFTYLSLVSAFIGVARLFCKQQRKQVKKSDMNDFPNEIILEIFKHLTQNELGQIARVCRAWHDLTKNPVLWQKVDVKFHWSHASQHAIVKSFMNKLPPSVTAIKVDFVEIDNWIQPLDFQEMCKTLHEKFPHLKKLILYESKLSNTHPSVIHLCSQFLPNVTSFVLMFPKFLDSLAKIEYDTISKIEILDITGSDMRHFNKSLFSKMVNLKQLYLWGTYLDDNWFEGDISFMNGLEVLHLGDTLVHSTTFRAIKDHGLNLKELYMCRTELDDEDLKFGCSTLPHLETICLNQCEGVTHEGVVSVIKSCSSLQNIYVSRFVCAPYAKHSFITASHCKLGIVKAIVDCGEHRKKYY